ncbi:MAG: hypothetical protein MJK10_05355 [Pseudomonadales bacterium]|nr:hypothetical protein [Pseudomonadales bacterium]NRA18752.1 hypothetical protein [Oceanospirillaceae bacterium]
MLQQQNIHSTASVKAVVQVARFDTTKEIAKDSAKELNTIRRSQKVKTSPADPIYDFVGVAG